MRLILTIAWRNLWRHRGQSLVVGAILFLGALFMTLGNGVISGMDRGLQRTIAQSFTGDWVLVPDAQESDNVFLEMMGRAIEPLNNYPAVRDFLKTRDDIEKFLPMGKNLAMVFNEDGGMPTFLYLLGVDFVEYAEMFPANLDLKEGRLPAARGPGLLLPTGARKEVHLQTNIWFIPKGSTLDTSNLEGEAKGKSGELSVKSDMVLMGFNQDNSATDLRLPIDGVFRYRALNTLFGSFALVDIESYRQCLGYIRADEGGLTEISSGDSALFAMDGENLDALFSDATALTTTNRPSVKPTSDTVPSEVPDLPLDTALNAAQAAPIAVQPVDRHAGAYNIVALAVKPGMATEPRLAAFNQALRDAGLKTRAVTWKKALGPVGSMAVLIKGALFVFVSLLFLVAVLIIINTLTMAALERTAEIGMMRAIGAHKGFIGHMFLAETAMLAFTFGGAGIAAGGLVIELFAALKLTSDNDMLQLFYGGDTFRPLIEGGDIVLATVQLTLVTVAAVLYPLLLARGVTPIQAVQSE
jgi:ABC-type lipoprotein release transport system permease subunit